MFTFLNTLSKQPGFTLVMAKDYHEAVSLIKERMSGQVKICDVIHCDKHVLMNSGKVIYMYEREKYGA